MPMHAGIGKGCASDARMGNPDRRRSPMAQARARR